jgi:hypothetical protein
MQQHGVDHREVAVLAPMPSARVASAATVNAGSFTTPRTARRRSAITWSVTKELDLVNMAPMNGNPESGARLALSLTAFQVFQPALYTFSRDSDEQTEQANEKPAEVE